MYRVLPYSYLSLTILFIVYGQITLKWRVSKIENFSSLAEFNSYKSIFNLLIDPWVVTILAAAFCSFITWTMTLKYLDLSFAYPFVGISFVLVMLLSALFFGELLTAQKIIGTILLVVSLVLITK